MQETAGKKTEAGGKRSNRAGWLEKHLKFQKNSKEKRKQQQFFNIKKEKIAEKNGKRSKK